jgi:hypothetical protein
MKPIADEGRYDLEARCRRAEEKLAQLQVFIKILHPNGVHPGDCMDFGRRLREILGEAEELDV